MEKSRKDDSQYSPTVRPWRLKAGEEQKRAAKEAGGWNNGLLLYKILLHSPLRVPPEELFVLHMTDNWIPATTTHRSTLNGFQEYQFPLHIGIGNFCGPTIGSSNFDYPPSPNDGMWNLAFSWSDFLIRSPHLLPHSVNGIHNTSSVGFA